MDNKDHEDHLILQQERAQRQYVGAVWDRMPPGSL